MPLYDITNGMPKKPVKPTDAENYIVLVKLRNTLAKGTYDRMVKTVDEAVDSVQPSANSKLVWTRSAALFGHDSTQPHRYVDHLWDNVIATVGANKLALKAVGGLLRWRISLRPDTWLAYRRDSNDVDPENGKLITISEYWINNSWNVPTAGSVDALAKSWGAKIK